MDVVPTKWSFQRVQGRINLQIGSIIRFLLAYLVLSNLCLHGSCKPYRPPFDDVRVEATNPDTGRQPIRELLLYSRCSEKYVQVVGRHINAKGTNKTKGRKYATLRIQAVEFNSTVTIQGADSKNYICFNKKGGLTARQLGTSRRCLFKEIVTDDYFTEFQSVHNPQYYLAFKPNGNPFRHRDFSRRKWGDRCLKFIKPEHHYIPNGHGRAPKPFGKFTDKYLETIGQRDDT